MIAACLAAYLAFCIPDRSMAPNPEPFAIIASESKAVRPLSTLNRREIVGGVLYNAIDCDAAGCRIHAAFVPDADAARVAAAGTVQADLLTIAPKNAVYLASVLSDVQYVVTINGAKQYADVRLFTTPDGCVMLGDLICLPPDYLQAWTPGGNIRDTSEDYPVQTVNRLHPGLRLVGAPGDVARSRRLTDMKARPVGSRIFYSYMTCNPGRALRCVLDIKSLSSDGADLRGAAAENYARGVVRPTTINVYADQATLNQALRDIRIAFVEDGKRTLIPLSDLGVEIPRDNARFGAPGNR